MDHRCCRRAMSEVWMQQSVMYCGALCHRHRWTVAHSLYCTRWGTSSQCSQCEMWAGQSISCVCDLCHCAVYVLCAGRAGTWHRCQLCLSEQWQLTRGEWNTWWPGQRVGSRDFADSLQAARSLFCTLFSVSHLRRLNVLTAVHSIRRSLLLQM